jgi:hypothetical protein
MLAITAAPRRLVLPAALLASGLASACSGGRLSDGAGGPRRPDPPDSGLAGPARDGGVVDPGDLSGPAPVAPLGPAPSGDFTHVTDLELRDDHGTARSGEIAWSSVPIPRELGLRDTSGLVVVGPGEQRLQAQLEPKARWGAPLDDGSAPIRWLGVAVQAAVPADGAAVYALRRYASADTPPDALAARIEANGAGWRVDTGLARFELDPSNPAVIAEIAIGAEVVYRHRPGAGPRLELGGEVLGTGALGQASVDAGAFRILERGPVRVSVAVDGHFHPAGGSGCDERPGADTLGYTAVLAFERGSADVSMEIELRNECGDAFSGTWTDGAILVDAMGWDFPLEGRGSGRAIGAASGPARVGGAEVEVEQRRGAGRPWRRRAELRVDGRVEQSVETLEAPAAGRVDDRLLALVQIPWMRFREPQLVFARADTVGFELISEPSRLGEAKGLWGLARLALRPASELAELETLRARGDAALERGLLVRAPVRSFNQARVLPSLGTEASSTPKATYLEYMELLHADTIGPQWRDAKTYGAQLWPDTQFDPYGTENGEPTENSGRMNYWNPSGAELLEFARGGDPRWVWDFAMPQSWLQLITAYCNVGEHRVGNRNGFALTSGGDGDGDWHRSAFGSDDYTYDMGLNLAYALRPSHLVQRRFAQAGRNFIGRYDVPRAQQASREDATSRIEITRQVVQHLELLADCAEFVPGEDGRACHAKLLEVLTELVEENFTAGLLCEGDEPVTRRCSLDQQFMTNGLHLPFFARVVLNWGDVAGGLLRAVAGTPMHLYVYGLSKTAALPDAERSGLAALAAIPERPDLVPDGVWPNRMECPLVDDRTAAVRCEAVEDEGIDFEMYYPNRPHSVASLLIAHDLVPELRLCGVSKRVLDDDQFLRYWDEYVADGVGWSKGSAQMMQGIVYAIGAYDTCADP